jgi:hypothetical protein
LILIGYGIPGFQQKALRPDGVRDQPLSGASERYTTTITIQKRDAKLRLQRFDMHGNVRLNGMKSFCRPCDAAILRNC